MNKVRQENGQGLIEYAFIIVLISLIVIAVLALLGPAIARTYYQIVSAI